MYKFQKIWYNHKPGLYVEPCKGTLHKVLVYIDGCWMEKFVEQSSLTPRNVNISKYIFLERKKTLKYERIT